MMTLSRGQKVKLADLTSSALLNIDINLKFNTETIDFSCFGVDKNNKLSDDRYMIFYNQLSSPEEAIKILNAGNSNPQRFSVDLSKLPQSIVKLVFVGTIDGQGTMSALQQGQFTISDIHQNAIATSNLNSADFTSEKAVMVLEIYKKENIWRIANVCQGFADGLSGVLKYFGGEETHQTPTASSQNSKPVDTVSNSNNPPKLSLTKLTLNKRGDSQKIDLSKRTTNNPIHINLNWENVSKEDSEKPKSSGFFSGIIDVLTNSSGGDSKIDLDLGCMYELKNGDLGVIQPLGGNFGNQNYSPFILLDKDDRTGTAVDGENMNLFRPDLIKRVLIFAFIYEGTGFFQSVNARVLIEDKGSHEITVNLDNADANNPFCAVCLIENENNQIKITKEERYFRDHEKADHHYNFGFNWRSGSK